MSTDLVDLPEGWERAKVAEVTVKVPNIKPEDEPELLFAYVDISFIDNHTNSITSTKLFTGKKAPSRA